MEKQIKILFYLVIFLVLACVSRADIYTPGTYRTKGEVKAVYSDFFTILTQSEVAKSSDANKTRKGEFTLYTDSQTRYDNVINLGDLKEGDKVVVDYRHAEKNRNVANSVTKVKSEEYESTRVYNDDNESTMTKTTITTTTTTYP